MSPEPQGPSTQLRTELHAVLKRWAEESDVSICEAIGVMRIVEHDLMNMLRQQNLDADTEPRDLV